MNVITRMSPEPMQDDVFLKRMREIILAEPCRGFPKDPSRVLQHVYIGSQTNAESLRLLRRLGVTHVLNCAGYKGPRPGGVVSPYEGLGIDYYEFKAEDTESYDIVRHFYEAFRYLDQVERQGGICLVHCAMGVNRSAAVCLGYLMVHDTVSLLKATKILKDKRRILLANRGFQRQLVRFARKRGLLDRNIIPDSMELQRRASVDLRDQRRASLGYVDPGISQFSRQPSPGPPGLRSRSASLPRNSLEGSNDLLSAAIRQRVTSPRLNLDYGVNDRGLYRLPPSRIRTRPVVAGDYVRTREPSPGRTPVTHTYVSSVNLNPRLLPHPPPTRRRYVVRDETAY